MIEGKASTLFARWATSYSGCDGGDIGSAERRATWFCGIEWGGGHVANVEVLNTMFAEDLRQPPIGYDTWEENLAYIFNWQAMKLLSVINGRQVSDYKSFAKEVKPFTSGSRGYFKMNLYPLAFRNTSHEHWASEFAQATGLADKASYLSWIKANRFPAMRAWTDQHLPKVIVCAGITYLHDFRLAFGEEEMNLTTEIIDDRQLVFGFNTLGTLIVVIPFMVNRNGLTRNASIQKFGERIRSLLSFGD